MDKGGPPDYDRAVAVFPYAKTCCIIYLICRVILFFICFKCPELIKYSLYYELLFVCFDAALPFEIVVNKEIQLTSISIILNVILNYFDLLPSLIAALLALIPLFVKRAVYYEDEVSGLIVQYLAASFWVLINVTCLNLVITKVGMIYVDAAVLREGKDETLENLNEGLVILDENDLEVLYYNKAAFVQKNVHQESATVINLDINEKPNYTNFVKENH